jgi:hypothetical protein
MNEITLTTYQATIFNIVEGYFSSKGYLGEDLFEDTYVLQKKLVEYVVSNVSLNRGSESDSNIANRVYNAVLNISGKPGIQPAGGEVIIREEPASGGSPVTTAEEGRVVG